MDTFTIEAAFKKWRATAAASEGISTDAIDELEEHLRESTATLQAKGLSPEEAFLIASRRLGSCEVLDSQFSAVSTPTVWKRRLFWMLLGFINLSALLTAVTVIGGLGTWAATAMTPSSAALPIWSTLSYAAPILLFVLLGIVTWRWMVRSSSNQVVEVIGKHPLLFSIAVLVTVLALRASSHVYTMLAVQSLSAENFGRIAMNGSIAGIAIGTLSLIAVCVGLGTLAKSLGQAETSDQA